VILRPDGGKLTCYYSLGDFLSHTQTDFSPDTMLGALAYITIKKTAYPDGTSAAEITTAGIIPTVCDYGRQRRPPFTVYPLYAYTKELVDQHYKRDITLDYLWETSRKIFGARVMEGNPFGQ
jgi:hypothetical protein